MSLLSLILLVVTSVRLVVFGAGWSCFVGGVVVVVELVLIVFQSRTVGWCHLALGQDFVFVGHLVLP